MGKKQLSTEIKVMINNKHQSHTDFGEQQATSNNIAQFGSL
jgi:hypothetical protein